RADFTMRAERTIKGRVMLDCKGSTSCSLLPVSGVRVRASGARKYAATTDDEGRYKLRVRKGRYKLTASAGDLRITSGQGRRVDLRKARSRTGRFTACGFRSQATGRAVPRGPGS